MSVCGRSRCTRGASQLSQVLGTRWLGVCCAVHVYVCAVGASSTAPSGGGAGLWGDDAVSYETEARGQFAVPEGGGRQAKAKPVGGSVVFGSDAVDFKSATHGAFGAREGLSAGTLGVTRGGTWVAWCVAEGWFGSLCIVRLSREGSRRVRGLVSLCGWVCHVWVCVCAWTGPPQGGGHGLRLGDDRVDYTSSAAAQARSVADAGVQPRREAVRAGGGASTSVSFGSHGPEFTTTTSAATQRHDVVFEGRRAVNVQKTSFALGDDAACFVSTRMAEEGLEARPQGTRYRPVAGAAGPPPSVTGAKVAKASSAPKASWTLGSSEWAPETSASASFRWPEGGGGGNQGDGRGVLCCEHRVLGCWGRVGVSLAGTTVCDVCDV